MIRISHGSWRAFVPACLLFAVAFIPLFALDVWGKLTGHTSDELAGAFLVWGLLVTLPAGICGCLALIGGLVSFFIISKDNSK